MADLVPQWAEAYAEAVFRCRVPVYGEDQIARSVAGRTQRQKILQGRSAPMTGFVTGNSARITMRWRS